MYKPTFIPPQHRPNLKRPAARFNDEDEVDENTVRVLDNHPRSIPMALSSVIDNANANANEPQPGITKKHPVSIFSPRPKKRTRLGLGVVASASGPPQPVCFSLASARAAPPKLTQKPKPKNTPHPARVAPKTPRKRTNEEEEEEEAPTPLLPSTPSSSSSSRPFTSLFPSTPSNNYNNKDPSLFPRTPSRSARPHKTTSSNSSSQHYTPYPTHASDSPSNPLGPACARRLKRTIPLPTSLKRHVVFRFQFVRGAASAIGLGAGGQQNEHMVEEEEAEAEASGKEEQEDTAPRQGGVHRIVRVPMSYTFAHLKCLTGWLFDEGSRPLPGPVQKSGERGRRDTWFDGEEDDDDYELNDEEEDEDYEVIEDNDENDPFSSSLSKKKDPPPPYPYLFEVQKKVCTYSPLYKPGQIKTGTPFVKLSSVRDPVATIISAAASNAALGEGVDGDEDEDELCLDGDEKENAVNEQEEEEEEEEWKWADEGDFTIGHIFPRGIDGEIGIIYHHSPTVQIHMTVNKSPVATQKGRANTPFVFSAQGRTRARLAGVVSGSGSSASGSGRGMAMTTMNTPLPLPKPVFSKTVEDILSSSPGHYSKAQVRSGVRARALGVTESERARRGIERGAKRAREEEEDVEEEIWSPFLFSSKAERRGGKRRRMYVEEEEEEGMEVEEEEDEDEEDEEAILTDTDADGEPECEDVDNEGLHDMDENHPFFFAEAEGSSPIKLVDEDEEEGDEMDEEEEEEDEKREEIILASDSEDSMYDEEGEAEEEKEEDRWNAPDAFINYLKTRGFHEQEPDEDDQSDDDDPTLKKRLKKKDDDDDDVIVADPSSTPGLTTCPSSSSSLPPSSPPPIIPIINQNKTKYTTHLANISSASLPARLPSSSTSSFSIPFSPKTTSSLIILDHHYPNKKYAFTPAPPRDPLCRLRIGRLEKRLRKMKSESVLTACDEPAEGEDPAGGSLVTTKGKENVVAAPVGEDVDELAGDDVLVGTEETEVWDPFGDEVEL